MPITLGDTTITGLSAGGLPSGVVNSTTLAANSVGRSQVGFAGNILQVVQSVFTGTFSGTSWYSDVGIDVNITPNFSNSKILITCHVQMGTSATTTGFSLYRNGSQISGAQGDGESARPRVTCIIGVQNAAWQGVGFCHYIDSPATTSSINYDLRFGSHDQRTWVLNRSLNDADGANWDNARSITTLTAYEISG
jgi:hypothetical protein